MPLDEIAGPYFFLSQAQLEQPVTGEVAEPEAAGQAEAAPDATGAPDAEPDATPEGAPGARPDATPDAAEEPDAGPVAPAISPEPAAPAVPADVAGVLPPALAPPTPTAAAASNARTPLPPRPLPDSFAGADFIEVFERDYALPLPATSAVPQDVAPDVSITIELGEGAAYIGNSVMYDGFLTNDKVPGPTVIVEEGDIVEFNVVNNGDIPHGASIHAAYTQTSKYLGNIAPGATARVVFQVNHPGIYLYHCAPGGHAIPMHVLFGQYGMMVVKPKAQKFQLEVDMGREPDLELYLMQHELYASGKDAVNGDAAYVMFNGKLFRYIEEPISVRPGDFVRIYFLNAGPNLLSTFHIVGIIWDYVYWQGHPEAIWPGGQSVAAGPTDSWVIEFRIPPDEGAYTMLSHAVGSTSRGAIGLLVADREAETPPVVLADGPDQKPEQSEWLMDQATRVISPFRPGTHPSDAPVIYGPETKEVHVSIIGNSYSPKVVQVEPGTRITWTNEDTFAYLAGEFSGVHNVQVRSAPPDADIVVSPLLSHGESFGHVFEEEWEYEYVCTPHPYMLGKVIVKRDEERAVAAAGTTVAAAPVAGWLIPLLGLSLVLSLFALAKNGGGKTRAADTTDA